MSNKQVKSGDMVMIVEAPFDPDHLGKIVTAIGLKFDDDGLPGWKTQPILCRDEGAEMVEILWDDRSIIPIRDNPGTDETLTWVPKISNAPEHA